MLKPKSKILDTEILNYYIVVYEKYGITFYSDVYMNEIIDYLQDLSENNYFLIGLKIPGYDI